MRVSDRIQFDAIGFLVSLKYTVGETCSTVTHIGAARQAGPVSELK